MKRRKFGGLILSGLLFGSGGCVDLKGPEETETNGRPNTYNYNLSLENKSQQQVNVQIDVLNGEEGAVYRDSIIIRQNEQKDVFDFGSVEQAEYVIRATYEGEVKKMDFSTDGCESSPKIIVTEEGNLVLTKTEIKC